MIITPPADIVTPKPSVILHPGIRALEDNVERYVAEGGGSVIIEVGAGDVIEVIDLEGCQACEIIGIGKDGRFDAAVLGESRVMMPTALKRSLPMVMRVRVKRWLL